MVPERMRREEAQERHEHLWGVLLPARDDEDLAERKRDALSELVGPGHRVVHEPLLCRDQKQGTGRKVGIARGRLVELLLEVPFES